jgi:hypothetical protein
MAALTEGVLGPNIIGHRYQTKVGLLSARFFRTDYVTMARGDERVRGGAG